MRVLIVYEDSHRAYGEALERAIRGLRPSVEVSLVQARELGGRWGVSIRIWWSLVSRTRWIPGEGRRG